MPTPRPEFLDKNRIISRGISVKRLIDSDRRILSSSCASFRRIKGMRPNGICSADASSRLSGPRAACRRYVKELVPHAGIETFDETVFPRVAGERFRPSLPRQPQPAPLWRGTPSRAHRNGFGLGRCAEPWNAPNDRLFSRKYELWLACYPPGASVLGALTDWVAL